MRDAVDPVGELRVEVVQPEKRRASKKEWRRYWMVRSTLPFCPGRARRGAVQNGSDRPAREAEDGNGCARPGARGRRSCTLVSVVHGWIATQIRSSIVVLLAGGHPRQEDLYGERKFPWTMMRHFLAMGALPVGVAEASFGARLVPAPSLPDRAAPRPLTADQSAVPIPPIASSADEEDLAARGPSANDKPERFHVPGAPPPRKWTSSSARATTASSATSL